MELMYYQYALSATNLALIANHDYFDASQYFVSISKQRYAQLGREGKLRQIADSEGNLKGKRWMVDVLYDSENGLQFDTPAHDRDWS